MLYLNHLPEPPPHWTDFHKIWFGDITGRNYSKFYRRRLRDFNSVMARISPLPTSVAVIARCTLQGVQQVLLMPTGKPTWSKGVENYTFVMPPNLSSTSCDLDLWPPTPELVVSRPRHVDHALLLVCVLWTIIGQQQNSVFVRRV